MSEFFPIPKPIKLNPHVELEVFQCQDTIFQLYVIAPNAKLESHQHPESQIGMVFSGELELYIKDVIKPLRPLQDVYIADGNIPHGAFNPLSEPMIGFDLKRITSSLPSEDVVLTLSNNQDKITHLPCQSVKGSWFEIVMMKIPSGYSIPPHQGEQEEIGFILNGKLEIFIENEEQCLEYGQIYYAPSKVLKKGYNSSNQDINLIKILI
ncbi:MAG: cupin domain-containing protein [Microcystis sp. M54BS1]|uniref:cupin domain-containing protein n=1 Tax=unclassified Microcystis TaxID=2643300 RepID=UPI00257D2377|nr:MULTISPECIES: cupin domain-containing protein [unclassified Microcystis]MCA2541380.1 cupin domain-containing protein [Microcystis sp. M54BS1]MCA2596581.1 cupin domain-containing protein [Microcystis sp. M38BS1]MCA2611058.1 cupin domain-containing protein [Microcystis sp. M27BS1]MCA2505877.1 cupin domain-containing protein [Microcystis sp. M62BS1]MCA2512304.1 cupin domain-containing protein [Microcystis sp. M60BS1]